MKHLTNILDKVANELEARGLKKLAAEVDVVSNSLDTKRKLQRIIQNIVRVYDHVFEPHGVLKTMRSHETPYDTNKELSKLEVLLNDISRDLGIPLVGVNAPRDNTDANDTESRRKYFEAVLGSRLPKLREAWHKNNDALVAKASEIDLDKYIKDVENITSSLGLPDLFRRIDP